MRTRAKAAYAAHEWLEHMVASEGVEHCTLAPMLTEDAEIKLGLLNTFDR